MHLPNVNNDNFCHFNFQHWNNYFLFPSELIGLFKRIFLKKRVNQKFGVPNVDRLTQLCLCQWLKSYCVLTPCIEMANHLSMLSSHLHLRGLVSPFGFTRCPLHGDAQRMSVIQSKILIANPHNPKHLLRFPVWV